MSECIRIRLWGSDLDRLNEDQFEDFLEHAVFCRSCEALLKRYEDNFLPILREALSNEKPIPATVIPLNISWRERTKRYWAEISRIRLPGIAAGMVHFAQKSILRPVYRFVQVQVTTLTIAIIAIGGILMGWQTLEENYMAPLTRDELESMIETVRVDPTMQTGGERKPNTDVPASESEVKRQLVRLPAPSNTAIKDPAGQTSVELESMEVDPGASPPTDQNKNASMRETPPDPRPATDDRKKDKKPVYGILNIRVIAGEGEPVLCTARKQFGETRFTISQTTYNGLCRWNGQELNQSYLITAKSTKTGVRKEFIVVASSDDTFVTEIRLRD